MNYKFWCKQCGSNLIIVESTLCDEIEESTVFSIQPCPSCMREKVKESFKIGRENAITELCISKEEQTSELEEKIKSIVHKEISSSLEISDFNNGRWLEIILKLKGNPISSCILRELN